MTRRRVPFIRHDSTASSTTSSDSLHRLLRPRGVVSARRGPPHPVHTVRGFATPFRSLATTTRRASPCPAARELAGSPCARAHTLGESALGRGMHSAPIHEIKARPRTRGTTHSTRHATTHAYYALHTARAARTHAARHTVRETNTEPTPRDGTAQRSLLNCVPLLSAHKRRAPRTLPPLPTPRSYFPILLLLSPRSPLAPPAPAPAPRPVLLAPHSAASHYSPPRPPNQTDAPVVPAPHPAPLAPTLSPPPPKKIDAEKRRSSPNAAPAKSAMRTGAARTRVKVQMRHAKKSGGGDEDLWGENEG
ncbi:hypothetical protein K438DRAFT_1982076 [Mycena galopus ATCC 62051]|nr:hypothetical protein K438DRAFT_1982076 [Mycena galopus ATCC 62051]